MRLELTGRHITITPAIRKLVDQQLSHLLRMLNDSVVSTQIVLTKEKSRVHCDATVHVRGDKFLHGEATGADIATALAAAAAKLDRQAQKLKSRRTEGKRQGISAAKAGAAAPRPERGRRAFGEPMPPAPVDDGAEQVRVIKARRYAVKPLSIDEAAVALIDGRDAFLVFRNAANDEITVLYRRPDGNLGLIEPEA